MADQRQKKDADIFGAFKLGFSMPKTKGALDKAKSALRAEHEELMKEQEKEEANEKTKGKISKSAKKKRPKTRICCCESSSCSIGPFKETEGGEEDEDVENS